MSPLSRHRDGRGRTAKHTRSVRRLNTDLSRQLRRMSKAGRSAYATLLAVLAQKGGEIVVTQGTIDQITKTFNDVSFVVEPQKDVAGEFVVRLVVGHENTADTPAETPADCLGTTDAEGTPDVEAVV